MWIIFEIVEFPARRGRAELSPAETRIQRQSVKERELVAIIAHSVMARNVMVGEVHPIPVVHGVPPVFRRLTRDDSPQASALHLDDLRRLGDVGKIEQCLSEVQVGTKMRVVHRTRRNRTRQTDEEGHLKALFVNPPLVKIIVFAEKHALVGGVNHDGIFREARCVEIIENAADVFINGFHTAQVVVKVLLIGRFALLFVRQARQVDRTGRPIGLLHIGDHRPPRSQPTGDRRAHLASRLRAM